MTSRNLPLRMKQATVLGVTPDAWTSEGRPGYVIMDATSSPGPVSMDMWFTCWAKETEYPIRLTISDGGDENIEYTFTEPLQLRVPLPEVPAGESRIFSVKTDKTWFRVGGDPTTKLGVQITASI